MRLILGNVETGFLSNRGHLLSALLSEMPLLLSGEAWFLPHLSNILHEFDQLPHHIQRGIPIFPEFGPLFVVIRDGDSARFRRPGCGQRQIRGGLA